MDHPFLSLVGLIVNLLQLKSQGNGSGNGDHVVTGNNTSPFDTYPAIMLLGVLCLLLYFWTDLASSTAPDTSMAAGAGSTSSTSSSLSSRLLAKIVCSAKPLMVVFGSMAVATLAYPLFPNSAQRHIFYALYAIMWWGAVLRCLWLQWRTRNVPPSPSSLPNRRRRSRRTRGRRRRSLLPLSIRDGQVQQTPRANMEPIPDKPS